MRHVNMPTPAPGDFAPDFPLADGGAARLSDLRGAPVVVAFPGIRWDPARAAYLAAYNAVVADLPGDAGARLLSVGDRGASGAVEWRELAFAATPGAGPGVGAAAPPGGALYGVGDGPAVFVLDAAGRVRWRHAEEDRTLPPPDAVRLALHALAAPAPGAGATAGRLTRREFAAAAFGAAVALSLPRPARAGGAPHLPRGDMPNVPDAPPLVPLAGAPVSGAPVPVVLHVNGRDLRLTLEPRVTLLDALREYAGLTGSKKGCDHGQCGACTVHVDGQRVLSCLSLAVMQQGKAITTIEGLAATAGAAAAADGLHPVQRAFIAHDGFQCGYCTPGQVMSASAVLREPWGPGDDDVREAMSGNVCRCGAYPGILAAVQAARRALPPTRAEA